MKQIFLIEDDAAIAKNLGLLLQTEGYAVICANTQKQAMDMLDKQVFDLALVDIFLPDGNGFAVCTEIKHRQDIPVIFLTASGDEASVVTGLTIGADDYITKPFRPRELVARIQAALRKSGRMPTVGEFVTNNTLTVYIKRLREKNEEDPSHPQMIVTVRGLGYRLGGNHVSEP